MNRLERATLLRSLSPEELEALESCWDFWARDEQLPPTDRPWAFWLLLGGRGAGKTAALTAWACSMAEQNPGARIGVVARTAADARDVLIEGESGIIEMARRYWPNAVPRHEPSKRRLTWPNGSQAATYSDAEGDQLRGPQHHFAVGDECATWSAETMSNLRLGLRLGKMPRAAFATTPRPSRLLRDLMSDPACVTSRCSTYANKDNLPPSFFSAVLKRYEGTSLARQEILGEVLDEAPGALWKRADLDRSRVFVAPDLVRLVVAVDPSVGDGEDHHDECGIVIGGVDAEGIGHLIEDASLRASPAAWARRAIERYDAVGADRLIFEDNQGGVAVEQLIELTAREMHREGKRSSPHVAITGVHASRGKAVRAGPVVGLSEQGRIRHVGPFPALEDELCGWEEGMPSPGRLDAFVWCFTHLMLDGDAGHALVLEPGHRWGHLRADVPRSRWRNG